MNFFFTNVAYADGVDDFMAKVNEHVLNPVVLLLFTVAFIYFLWGVSQFILNSESSDDAKTNGKNHMLWGVIGMTIMFSVWGILGIVLGTFNITDINPEEGTVNLNDYTPSIKKLGN